MEEPLEDWVYSVGLRGELAFADYEVAYAANNDEKSGYKIEVGKKYGPEPEEDEEDTRTQWKVAYKGVDDGYQRYLVDKGIDSYESNLSLTADNFEIFGLTLGGAYVTKDANANLYKEEEDRKTDVSAMKFTAEKKDLFGIPLTIGGQYASIENDIVDDGSSLLAKIAYEPTFGNLQLKAGYEYTTNAIDGDFDAPGDWVEAWKIGTADDSPTYGDVVSEQTINLSAMYPLVIWDTTITGLVGYENRTSDMKETRGREYVDPLMTYKVSAERDFGDANILASYQYRSGGPDDVDGKDEGKYAKIDKITEVKLTYPVAEVADLELGYRFVDVETYDKVHNYKATELNAGLKFEF